jgi:asparagine synthase (glutamine-hydrolysing)
MSKTVRHRGPDWSGIFSNDKAIMAHERLSIVDPESGGQPLYSKDRKLVLAVNGEIYNHREIRKHFEGKYEFLTQSDCEVILVLYREKGPNFLEDLNGIFAFALYDIENNCFLIGRDHIGIIPLYQGWDKDGAYYVASELKALEGYCNKIEEFLPGQYFYSPDVGTRSTHIGKFFRFGYIHHQITFFAVLANYLSGINVGLRFDKKSTPILQFIQCISISIARFAGNNRTILSFFYVAFPRLKFEKTVSHDGFTCRKRKNDIVESDNSS